MKTTKLLAGLLLVVAMTACSDNNHSNKSDSEMMDSTNTGMDRTSTNPDTTTRMNPENHPGMNKDSVR